MHSSPDHGVASPAWLDSAIVYRAFQRLLGGHAARQRLVHEFICPAPVARVLDLGCGTATLLAYLPAGVDYVGIDSNPAYIAAAARHHGRRGRFFCGRVEKPPEKALAAGFDLVLGMGLLHHLDDEEAHSVVALAHRALDPGGHLVTLDAVVHEGQVWLARRLAAADRGVHIRTPEGYRGLVAARFSDPATHLITDLLRVPYSHFIIRAQKG